jgi:hypothetical protein
MTSTSLQIDYIFTMEGDEIKQLPDVKPDFFVFGLCCGS